MATTCLLDFTPTPLHFIFSSLSAQNRFFIDVTRKPVIWVDIQSLSTPTFHGPPCTNFDKNKAWISPLCGSREGLCEGGSGDRAYLIVLSTFFSSARGHLI